MLWLKWGCLRRWRVGRREQFTEVTTAGLSKGIYEPRVEGGVSELAIQPSGGGGTLQTGEQRCKDPKTGIPKRAPACLHGVK